MVFEKIVVDVLNRFLSDYIQDLDTSQLKLGIWGGDAIFTNLHLKTSALNDLELPIETVYGLLGKLILKIPWKNLYQEPVVVLVERLFIIAEPNLEVKYNPITENKKLQDEKQRYLDEFENNRKLREEGPNAQPLQDTFSEKLMTQILKNIQIKISNIHIRYEDKVTNPKMPFALGLTMHTLDFNTADGVEDKAPWQIFKVMNLECLGLYWNCECMRISDFTKEDVAATLEQTIAQRGYNPDKFNYVFGPLYIVAKLSASQKPENDEPAYSIPVMKINLEMERLDIQLQKQQFQDLMLLNETMDRMNRGLPYRKYRPFLGQYSGHAKEWWHFAYECVINESIRRVKKNWDWSHIKGHRQVYKLYSKAFKEKIKKKGRVNEETKGQLEFCEDYLDSFNIILARKQVYFELELEEKQKQTNAKPKSWLTRWWSGSITDAGYSENIRDQFIKAVDAAERMKLYDAIGLDTDEITGPYPETYSDYVMTFLLSTIQIVLQNDKEEHIMELIVKSSRFHAENRSKFSGLRVEFTVKDLAMFGKKQMDYLPTILEPKGDFIMLLDILYEMAPLDKTCDERFHLMANPIQIIYDNATVESVMDIFTISSDDETVRNLADLNARAKLMNMKEMSTSGLQYALTTHSFFECKINILAPYIIIPFAGLNINPRSILVIDLGRLVVVTEPRVARRDTRTMMREGLDEEQILEKLILQSYDSFITSLTEVQILLVLENENSVVKGTSKITNQHIIQPVTLKITIQKCLIEDDPRLPSMKISGVLDSVQMNFSDTRMVEMTALATSFQSSTEPARQSIAMVADSKTGHDSHIIEQKKSNITSQLAEKLKEDEGKEGTPMRAQLVSLTADFRFGELAINLYKTVQATLTVDSDAPEYSNKFISLSVRELVFKMTQKTYDLCCDMGLGGIELLHYRSPENINIINTYKTFKHEKLFTISYTQVEEISPYFRTDYGSIRQKVVLDFHVLNVSLNQQSLTEIITESQRLQKKLEDIIALYTPPKPENDNISTKSGPNAGFKGEHVGYKTSKSSGTLLSRVIDYKKQQDMLQEITDLKITARIDEFSLHIASDKRKLATFALVGMALGIANKKSHNKITIKLKDIQLQDCNVKTIHKTIIEVVDGVALHCIIVLYDLKHTANLNKNDMSIVANIGCVKIIYLNWFVSTVTEFANSFQTAQQVIRDTAAEAADVMREQMQHTTRIQLNLHIKAPIVVVPISSHSFQVFIFDFGYITISNRFSNLKPGELEASHVVIDEMSLKLEDLQMSRASLSKALFVEREQTLLRPTTFSMTIKRNLSSNWYNKVPDIDVYGKIKSIQILLSQSDYAMAMQVVSQNFTEGGTGVATKEMERYSTNFGSSDWRLSRVSVDIMHKHSRISTAIIYSERRSDSKAITADLYMSLRFQFTMDVLTVDLFTGGTQFHTLKSKRLPRKGLARFSLLVLSLKGRQFSDESMSIDMLLCDCILDDTRSYRINKISRYLQRSTRSKPTTVHSAYKPLKSMLDLSYTATRHDTFVAVRVFSLNFILSMDYMTTVADFFSTPQSQDVEPVAVIKPSISEKELSAFKSKISVANIKTMPEEINRNCTMTIDLRLEQPDIILVESMDDIDCNCIIMNTEFLMRYRFVKEQIILTGSLKDLHVYNCVFDEERRDETMTTILKPCSINFLGASPLYEGLHIDVCITDITVNVSPAVLDLFTKIMETMNKEGFIEKAEELQDYSKIWLPENFNDSEYWFLKEEEFEVSYDEEGEEDDDIEKQVTIIENTSVEELCGLFIPSISLCLESGTLGKTTPLLLVEIKYEASCHNWSTQMHVNSDMWIKMAYYNDVHEVWESIIEPMENVVNEITIYTPWQLTVNLENKLIIDKDDIHQTRKISVISLNNLEITISKSCLEVLNTAQRSFGITETVKDMGDSEISGTPQFPYEIRNDSGFDVTLKLAEGPFVSCGKINYHQIVLGNGAQAYLQLKDPLSMKEMITEYDNLIPQAKEQVFLDLIIDYQKTRLSLPISRADKRYFMLPREGPASEPWALISDIQIHENITTLTLRSNVQVCNHLMTSVDIYYKKRYGGTITLIGTVEEESCINIPIQAVHASTGELYFSVQGYAISHTSYSCDQLQEAGNLEALLRCRILDSEEDVAFFIKVVGKVHSIYHELTTRHTSKSVFYMLKLKSSALFCNSLPISIKVKLYSIETLLDPGELLQMPHVEPGKCVVTLKVNYLDKTWICYHDISDVEGLAVWTFESYDSAGLLELNLGVHSISKKGTFTLTIYCPYWMINNTGLNLAYIKSKRTESLEMRGVQRNYMETPNVLYHPDDFKGPLMFSFHAKNFFDKKTARIRVDLGEWSVEFPLDTPGSGGSIECNANNMIYEIGISNTLTYNNLTKQIMFTPRYLLVNQTDYSFSIQEIDIPDAPWIDVVSKSVVPFWPTSKKVPKSIRVKCAYEDDITLPVTYTTPLTVLLRLDNSFGGIQVEVQAFDSSVYIMFQVYVPGMAPALVINHTEEILLTKDIAAPNFREVGPYQRMFFTWDNPSSHKQFCCYLRNRRIMHHDLRRDGTGRFKIKAKQFIYWSSFLHDMQRIVLFTQSKSIAQNSLIVKEDLIMDQIIVSIYGIGFSLVDNQQLLDIMYMRFASSGVLWEISKMKSKRFKQLPEEDMQSIEIAYVKYLTDTDVPGKFPNPRVEIKPSLEVDFKTNMLLRPMQRKLQRSFRPGLWAQLSTSKNEMHLHCKINHIQMDNQMRECAFPVVLDVVGKQKTVVNVEVKPFLELSIVKRLIPHSSLQQYKYFKLLIQEFHVKLDIPFMNAMLGMFEAEDTSEEEAAVLFSEDLKLVDKELWELVESGSQKEAKNFYDLLHFSPLKIHISFSLTAMDAAPTIITVLLQGIGVTLTEMHDVVLRLGFFERRYCMLSNNQLIGQAMSHYTSQAVKQAYVLMLGLDVLGNPFGLMVGYTKGFGDLFYEPLRGAIQGPNEFAEGLYIGVRSLFGHTVGGTAGAVSKITGAMGKGIAAMTFDHEYQHRRRKLMSKPPVNLTQNLIRCGKGLVMGVVDGVTGVFLKPFKGARDEGLKGFVKGIGKGAIGLVAKPTTGLIDFAADTFDAVKRATDLEYESPRIRLARFMHPDGLLRPYCSKSAEGYRLLLDAEKGRYSKELYEGHIWIIQGKQLLMLTDERILVLEKGDVFGTWRTLWAQSWVDIIDVEQFGAETLQVSGANDKQLFVPASLIQDFLLTTERLRKEAKYSDE